MITPNVTIKLYPLEYTHLYWHLDKLAQNTEALGLNATVSSMVLSGFLKRKETTIMHNALSKKGKPRSLTLKPHEAKALYDELKLYSYSDVILGQIFGHLNRALINLGLNALLNQ